MFSRIHAYARAKAMHLIDEAVRVRLDARFEQTEALMADLLDADRRSRRNIFQAAEREAVRTSALFAYEHFPTAMTFPHKSDTLRHAAELAPKEGMALEFGVWSGSTLQIIADTRPGDVYGFDSFEGLPEDWRTHFGSGTFAVEELPKVRGAELVVGWFDQTLPAFLAEHEGPIGLLHVDADLYSSAVTVLDLCGPRLVPGSVVIFDEYFNYPGWEEHEHRAWQEFVARTGLTFTWEGYSADDEQVVVKVVDPGKHETAG